MDFIRNSERPATAIPQALYIDGSPESIAAAIKILRQRQLERADVREKLLAITEKRREAVK